jgi:hypothetical protein
VEDARGEHGVAPASTAGVKSASAPAPPEAISGTVTLARTARISSEVVAGLGAVGVHRVEQDLAGAEVLRRAAHSTASMPVPRRPPCVVTSKPSGPRRASIDSTMHWEPKRCAASRRNSAWRPRRC